MTNRKRILKKAVAAWPRYCYKIRMYKSDLFLPCVELRNLFVGCEVANFCYFYRSLILLVRFVTTRAGLWIHLAGQIRTAILYFPISCRETAVFSLARSCIGLMNVRTFFHPFKTNYLIQRPFCDKGRQKERFEFKRCDFWAKKLLNDWD
jgi:hypothetical protein